jgi:hypothetical protein
MDTCRYRGLPSCSMEADTIVQVKFDGVSMRFYDYTIGESVPGDRGPSVGQLVPPLLNPLRCVLRGTHSVTGFGWKWESHGDFSCTLDSFESYRGVIMDEDEYDENEVGVHAEGMSLSVVLPPVHTGVE